MCSLTQPGFNGMGCGPEKVLEPSEGITLLSLFATVFEVTELW